jgi:hypothetical protein
MKSIEVLIPKISVISVWIRIQRSRFYLNADPDPGSQTDADPDTVQTLPSKSLILTSKMCFM